MKRYVKAARARSPLKKNVYDVCEFLDWRPPTFADKGKYGYICKWGGLSLVQHEAKDISDEKIYEEFGEDTRNWPDEAWDKRKQYYREAMPEGKKIVQGYVDEIYEKLGIECKLTPTGNLIVPFAEVEV